MSDPTLDKAIAAIDARREELRSIAGPSEADQAEDTELLRRKQAILAMDANAGATGDDGEPGAGAVDDGDDTEPDADEDDSESWAVQAGLVRPPAAPAPALTQDGVRRYPATTGYQQPAPPGPPVDALTAFWRGLYNPVGIADEMAGIGAAQAATRDRTRPMDTAGSARSGRAAEQERQTAAGQQHPLTYGTGRALGTAVVTAPLMATTPATIPGRVAAGFGEGGVLGGAIGAAEGEDGDRLAGAARGARTGAVIGGAIPSVIGAAQKVVGPLERFASTERAVATGPYGSQVARVGKQKGRDYLAEMGRTIERRGVDQRGGLLNRAPMGSGAYAERLNEVLPQVGAELDEVLSAAAAGGADVPTAWLRNRILARAKVLEQVKAGSAREQAAHLREIAGMIEDPKVKPRYSPREVQALKETWTGEVWKQANPQAPLGGNKAEAYRAAAGVPRELLDEAITRKVSPELAKKFQGLRDEYGHLKTAQDFAEGRELRETGNQSLSLPTTIAASGGMATGDPLTSLASGAAAAGWKNYGKDVLASFARGGQRVASGVGAIGRLPVEAEAGVAAAGARQSITAPAMAQSMTLDDAYSRVEQDPNAFGDKTDAVLDAIDADDQDALNQALSQVR